MNLSIQEKKIILTLRGSNINVARIHEMHITKFEECFIMNFRNQIKHLDKQMNSWNDRLSIVGNVIDDNLYDLTTVSGCNKLFLDIQEYQDNSMLQDDFFFMTIFTANEVIDKTKETWVVEYELSSEYSFKSGKDNKIIFEGLL